MKLVKNENLIISIDMKFKYEYGVNKFYSNTYMCLYNNNNNNNNNNE